MNLFLIEDHSLDINSGFGQLKNKSKGLHPIHSTQFKMPSDFSKDEI